MRNYKRVRGLSLVDPGSSFGAFSHIERMKVDAEANQGFAFAMSNVARLTPTASASGHVAASHCWN
jgi:hypothetical protein